MSTTVEKYALVYRLFPHSEAGDASPHECESCGPAVFYQQDGQTPLLRALVVQGQRVQAIKPRPEMGVE